MKKIYLTESELVGLIRNVINEQQTTVNPLFNVAIPQLIFQGNPQNQKQIFLSGTYKDSNGKLKKEVLKYNIQGFYLGKTFDVNLRNFERDKSKGGLYVQAQPSGWFIQQLVAKLIPKKNLTEDGWLKNYVSFEKLKEGIDKLKTTRGASADIDAGHGVKLRLTYAGR
jgi:hypothetical protein